MLQPILNLIAPVTCISCGTAGDVVCADCQSQIVRRPASCFRCNRLSEEGRTCNSCRTRTALGGVAVGVFYQGLAKELILALKFDRVTPAATAGAALITPLLGAQQFDLVTSVPSAPTRIRQRGYNQSALLARSVAKELGLPYRELLGRRSQIEQIGAGRHQRLAQVQGAFYARRQIKERVLVVDDVLTTGATLAECAAVLKQAGARRIWGAVVAKH